ncbi:efflux RND transporter periplasmic adaptor subunit [Novipirellula artificiosorum]|uniref:Macrolide export protein MacA n=1 Tax=Novipirellula artificiosorum TaxID=2528016 RepID=A0A5C6DA70_9BACT|nr:HlyD family efflux transporter periplasmic adaptor subunit [Novipirellula artificiosorum]TWU33025.1 Macrolide export protein MacA [Novipirellula artificiosorum]
MTLAICEPTGCEHAASECHLARLARKRARLRRGSIGTPLLAAAALLLVSGLIVQAVWGGVAGLFSSFFSETASIEFLTTPVIRQPFVYTVLERGEIESSSNVEVRCEVRSRNSSSIDILEIVPEGSWVEKGDFLVRLDDAALQTQLIQQQIVCSNSESSFIEAQATLDAARLGLDEYEQGTLPEQIEQQESAVFIARENMRRAEEYLAYSKRLAERGYIPEAQLEADTFAVEKARKELGVAVTKLEVIETYTKEKKLTELKADIKTAEARLDARRKTWELDKLQRKETEDLIAKCTIVAPVAGQVVYANNRDGRSSSSNTLLIAEGLSVRERQAIIYLPDPNNMQVMVKVHESRIGDVRPGLDAELSVRNIPEGTLRGRVTEVSEYPLPALNVYTAHVKEYAVLVEITDPPLELRPGMTAEVNLMIQRIEDALQVPIESIIERGEHCFCALPLDDGTLETREVTIGKTNETDVVITSGLTESDQVVLSLGDEEVLGLLDLPVEEETIAAKDS